MYTSQRAPSAIWGNAVEEMSYGGKAVGQALKESGVEHVFGVYGTINLAIESACQQGVRMLHFRHEQSAGFAADAYARCLRKPGVCFTSAAPGFANIVSPIAQAKSALSPVVLLNGQHGMTGDGLGTIQEGYAAEVLKPFAKWTHRALDWNLNSYWTKKALTESVQWPPGPVVLDFPRSSLNARGPSRQQKYVPGQNLRTGGTFAATSEVERLTRLLIDAKRPLIVAGDGVYWSKNSSSLRQLAEFLTVPVHTRRTARGAVPETHSLAVCGGFRGEIIRKADVICIVGHRATWLDEWFEPPEWGRAAKYVQIQESEGDIWPGLPTELAVVGTAGNVLQQMLNCARDLVTTSVSRGEWLREIADAREKFQSGQQQRVAKWRTSKLLHPHVLGAEIANFLDPASTIIYDSFTATSFLTDKLQVTYAGQVLDAGLHQPVGHSIGMCVGAQLARPGKQVLALIGDGGFGIGGMDMETLVRYNLPAVVVLFNNNGWASVAAGHDLFYPEMGSWETLPGVRYDRMFKEFGCHTEFVETSEQISPALERSFDSGKASLINVVGDTTEIHPLRMRVCWGDTWSRGNLHTLPAGAREQLQRECSPAYLQRIQKFWRDNGVEIPLEDLEALAGLSPKFDQS